MIYELSKYIKQPALQHHVGENNKENILNSRMIEPPFTWWFDSVIVLTFTNRRYTVIHEQIKNTYSDLLDINKLLFDPLIGFLNDLLLLSTSARRCINAKVNFYYCFILYQCTIVLFSSKIIGEQNNQHIIKIWKLKR